MTQSGHWCGAAITASAVLSGVGIVCVGKKQLLAIDLVVRDGLLALRRHQPVDELLSEVFLYIRMLVRAHQNDAVLIEQAFFALNHNFQITLFLEMNPCATVGKCIAVSAL